jgi:porphobilinogen synthase
MTYPIQQLRRLRQKASLRELVSENRLNLHDLIMPIFATAGSDLRTPLPSIPEVDLLAGRSLQNEVESIWQAGVPAVLLFGVLGKNLKDEEARCAQQPDNPTCQALRSIKEKCPEMVVIADLCLCEYTSHGHCGIVRHGYIDNDLTLKALAQAALAMARAGADVIAPSGVMDGVVLTLRTLLDAEGFQRVALMPYSAKYASHFYGPFKVASRSVPGISLHATHQLPVANQREALRKIQVDIAEGADMVIIKPALTSLDILAMAKQQTQIPLAGYDVSGFYKMIYDSCGSDQHVRQAMMMEVLTCIKRAGAQMIISYFAKTAARLLDCWQAASG